MGSPSSQLTLVDFSDPEASREFRVINDDVMGGVSISRLRRASGALVFEGTVSLENGGGFASFRGPISVPADAPELLLTVRGDGQRYKLGLKTDDAPGSPQYQASFVGTTEWRTLRFAPSDFRATLRGRALAAPPLEFGAVRYLGLVIADLQAGAFRIELQAVGIDRLPCD